MACGCMIKRLKYCLLYFSVVPNGGLDRKRSVLEGPKKTSKPLSQESRCLSRFEAGTFQIRNRITNQHT